MPVGSHVGIKGESREATLESKVRENPASLAFVPWKPGNNTNIRAGAHTSALGMRQQTPLHPKKEHRVLYDRGTSPH